MIRTIALALIAAILGAWLAFIVFGSDDGGDSSAHESSHIATTGDEHGHNGATGLVAKQLTANPEPVRHCVGAALEPFDGAMAQLNTAGPAEAAERMRFCVFETIIGHGDDQIMADLESHRPHFEECFGDLRDAEPSDKPHAVELVATCILDG